MTSPITTEQLLFFTVKDINDTPAGYQHSYGFNRKNQELSAAGYRETFEELNRFLVEKSLNYGLLITAEGFLVFTEVAVDFNQVMVKLTTGVDLLADMPFNFNNWLYSNGIDKNHAHFGHLVR